MNPVIERMVKNDINMTPYYRVIYRLTESDIYFKKVCNFICDVFEGKIQKPGLSTFSYNLEFMFSLFQLLQFKNDKEILNLKNLSNFLWTMSENKICFVKDMSDNAKKKFGIVPINKFSPETMKLNYYFISAFKSDGTVNTDISTDPIVALSPKGVSDLLDIIKNYTLQPYKIKK